MCECKVFGCCVCVRARARAREREQEDAREGGQDTVCVPGAPCQATSVPDRAPERAVEGRE